MLLMLTDSDIMTSAQRVGFFNIGSGRVLEKIPGSGSGSGRVGVLKYTTGYFRVSFYSRVFPGIPRYFRVSSLFLEVFLTLQKFTNNVPPTNP